MTQLRRMDTALLAATVAVTALALVPTMASYSPVIYWDVDPRSDAGRAAAQSFGPAGLLWWSVISIAVTAVALALHRASGRAICRVSTVLVGIGMAAAAWHMPTHLDNLLHGAAWIGAASLALATVHLAQHHHARKFIIAALVAMLVPQALESAMFIYREHPMTVEHFLKNEEMFLQSRGWERGSAAHELYLRRLGSPDAVGSFGLSNVFGSIIGALTLLSAVLVIDPLRKRNWKVAGLFAAPVIAGLFTISLTHSKGAAVAMAAAAGLLAVVWLQRRLLAPAAMALVVLAFVAVLARGAMGPPETHEGERSLLFRYHYWQGAARAIAAAPVSGKWLGIGPHGFRSAYHATKPPINPEDVDSTHNVFVDFVTMLGLGGAAWSAVLLWWLWQSARRAAASEDDEGGEKGDLLTNLEDRDVILVLVVAMILFGLHLYVEWASLLSETFAIKAGEAVLYIGVGALALSGRAIGRRGAAIGLAVMAAMVLIHAQIEMTFFRDGSAVVVWMMMAVAAADPKVKEETTPAKFKPVQLAMPAAVGAMALAMAVMAGVPVSKQQAALRRAAEAIQKEDVRGAYEGLGRAAAILPCDSDPRHWQVKLLIESAFAARQKGDMTQARSLLNQSIEVAQASGDPLQGLRATSRVRATLASWFNDADELNMAIDAAEKAIALTPYNLDGVLELAELQWRAERYDAAKQTYRRAVELSDLSYLDPAKQMTEAQRAVVTQRLDGEG